MPVLIFLFFQQRFQILPRKGSGILRDLLGRSLCDDLTAHIAALGTEVDDVVGCLDQVEVVLDDNHRVAALDKQLQHVDQAVNVRDMQTRRRLVENINRPARAAL